MTCPSVGHGSIFYAGFGVSLRYLLVFNYTWAPAAEGFIPT